MFTKFINPNGNFNKLLNSINSNERVTVFGTTLNEQMTLVGQQPNKVLYVTTSFEKANQIKDNLELQNKNCEIIDSGYMPNFSAFKQVGYSKIVSKLQELESGNLDVLIVLSPVLLNKLPNKDIIKTLKLNKGGKYSFNELTKTLIDFNYEKLEVASQECTFATRGDIVDIFPKNEKVGYRLSFFGNELEFIKVYDAVSGITQNGEVESISISSNNENFLTESERAHLISVLEKEISVSTGERLENLQAVLSATQLNSDKTAFSHVFSKNINSTIFSYLPKNTLIVFDEPKQIIDELHLYKTKFVENLALDYVGGFVLNEHKNFLFDLDELFVFEPHFTLLSFGNITTSNRIFAPQKVFNIKCSTLLNYTFQNNLLAQDVAYFKKQNFTIIIFAKSLEFAQNIESKLRQAGIESVIVNTLSTATKSSVNIVTKTQNTTLAVLEENLLVIGTNKLIKQSNKATNSHQTQVNLQELLPNIGDFVVHETHGIGKCVAQEKITISGITKDYIVIEYKNQDKLFLPVENLSSITKYIGGEKQPQLNKLGGIEFYKTKQKVRAELKETAFDLVELYNSRINLKGIKFNKDDEFMEAFENEFAFIETPDQLKTINEVKADMESEKIMDRLICGDVGYGKTEVALRAIFKAVTSGYQVAFLCPTTILSQQHFNTAVSRMQQFGVVVEVLNRFKSASEQKKIIQNLKDGKVDVIIGTHRLLSKDVEFKNLGLLVLDEEQKFGVSDKEKIKTLKKHIDVLTLSATPIPRSLHMALAGIRDISIINTPPPLKMPVITQVVEYRDELLKGAILQELDRDGQILIVHNNIGEIYAFATHVKALIGGDVKIGVAHGQMTETELEHEIFKLYNGETQILVSTTLIENGIDLPRANTLIVINSDTLGLSQLYQLKGRVGRGNQQAFAYFTYNHTKILNENAAKRLEAIAEFSELGDGYKIAMRDLEIRGAGQVLGVKQHGHLQKVGYSMYINLLQEAVKEIKGEKVLKNYDFKIDTDFNANLPNYFVESQILRINVYSQISKLSTLEELEKLVNTLTEQYGQIPQETINLAFVALIRNTLKTLPLKRVSLKQKEVILTFESAEDEFKNFATSALEKFKNNVVLNSNNLPIITLRNLQNLQHTHQVLKSILEISKN